MLGITGEDKFFTNTFTTEQNQNKNFTQILKAFVARNLAIEFYHSITVLLKL
jgi:hypothetical protein